MFQDINIENILIQALVLFLAIGLHEYAHCKVADLAGDPTPSKFGRVTLNLTKHFEPLGVIMMIVTSIAGRGIGWGRPSPMNPRLMRNPRWDHFAAVAAGPLSNMVQACIYAVLLQLMMRSGLFFNGINQYNALTLKFLYYGVYINIALACFNLIPFGPLDGRWLLGLLLPEKLRYRFFRFNDMVGMPGLLMVALLFPETFYRVYGPVADAAAKLLLPNI
ncbi:MAG: site-2 protease family protein [Armatimonadetes bacterium]|nr:site-2 protease family protein [Armatimonadota bacterium]